MDQRTWGPMDRSLEQAPSLHVYIQIYFQAGKLHEKSRSHEFP